MGIGHQHGFCDSTRWLTRHEIPGKEIGWIFLPVLLALLAWLRSIIIETLHCFACALMNSIGSFEL